MNFQNLREEMAMDLDEDEDATQRPREVQTYDIEVNFEDLADEDRQVRSHTPQQSHQL